MRKPSVKSINHNPVVEVENLFVTFNNREVLRNINLAIQPGEVVAIIGPNGSGKTTLLRAILGLVAYRGRIKVLGQPSFLVLNQVGYVPQKFLFDRTFPLTVREFLELSSHHRNKFDIERALREVEMTKQQAQILGHLSGGQLQRVLIARALLNFPRILFLDEPTAGIDLEGEKGFYELIAHQNKQHGVTVVLVSHELNVVYQYATQIICLNRDLVCFGDPKEVLTQEILERLYGKDLQVKTHKH